jgi:hypothetical protein
MCRAVCAQRHRVGGVGPLQRGASWAYLSVGRFTDLLVGRFPTRRLRRLGRLLSRRAVKIATTRVMTDATAVAIVSTVV